MSEMTVRDAVLRCVYNGEFYDDVWYGYFGIDPDKTILEWLAQRKEAMAILTYLAGEES